MELLKLAYKTTPEKTKKIFKKIHQTDSQINKISKKLILADDILLKSEHRLFNLLLDVWKERGVIEEDVSAIQYLKN